MAITLRSTSSATLTGAGTSITVDAPAGLTAGDVMYAVVESLDSAVTAPSGWVLDVSAASIPGGLTNYLNTFYKVATASEPATYTWSQASSSIFSVSIADYEGVNNTTPLNVAGVGDGGQSTASPAFPSITTTAAGCRILIGLAQNGGASVTFTTPTGYTQEVASAYGYYAQTFIADATQSAAGATGTLTGTISAWEPLATFTAALNPAPPIQALSGPITGSATSSASVRLLALLSAMAQGDATATAQIERIMGLTATVNGRSSLSAAITKLERMAASGSADGKLQATLLLARSIVGAARGDSSANAASLELFAGLAATASGRATALAALRQLIYLTATGAGSSSLRGSLYQSLGLAGLSHSQASATVSMTRLMLMDGSATGAARASGDLSIVAYLTGSALARAAATGRIQLEMLLSGAATGAGTADVGKVSAPVSAAGVGASTGSGSMDLLAGLTARAVSIGYASGNVIQERNLSGVAASVSISSGRLHVQADVSAEALSEAHASGVLTLIFRLRGESLSQAYGSATPPSFGSATPPSLIFTLIPDARFFVEPLADYFYSEPPASYYLVEPLADYFYSEGRMSQTFSSKNPLATRTATMSAVPNLDARETLTGINNVSVALVEGFDPNPAAIIAATPTPAINAVAITVDTKSGPVSIAAGMAVQLVLVGGNDGAKYLITAECSTSNPDKILALTAILPVSIYA